MARNVSEAEIDALLATPAVIPPRVAARDFTIPRSMARRDLDALQGAAEVAADRAREALRSMVACDVELLRQDLRETGVDAALAQGASEIVGVAGDGPAGQSIVLLGRDVARFMAETALGAVEPGAQAARALTAIEALVAEHALGKVLELAATAFQVAIQERRWCGSLAALQRELAGDPDRRRMELSVHLKFGVRDFELRILLPGVKVPAPKPRGASAAREARGTALPGSLAPAQVEVSAVLADREINLPDLLALEPGDVIPLDVAATEPILLHVEGVPRARAKFGERLGRLALCVTEILPPASHR